MGDNQSNMKNTSNSTNNDYSRGRVVNTNMQVHNPTTSKDIRTAKNEPPGFMWNKDKDKGIIGYSSNSGTSSSQNVAKEIEKNQASNSKLDKTAASISNVQEKIDLDSKVKEEKQINKHLSDSSVKDVNTGRQINTNMQVHNPTTSKDIRTAKNEPPGFMWNKDKGVIGYSSNSGASSSQNVAKEIEKNQASNSKLDKTAASISNVHEKIDLDSKVKEEKQINKHLSDSSVNDVNTGRQINTNMQVHNPTTSKDTRTAKNEPPGFMWNKDKGVIGYSSNSGASSSQNVAKEIEKNQASNSKLDKTAASISNVHEKIDLDLKAKEEKQELNKHLSDSSVKGVNILVLKDVPTEENITVLSNNELDKEETDSTSSTNSGTDTDEDSNEESSHEIEKSSLSIEAILILDLLNMSNSEREDLLIQKAVKYTILTEDPATKNLIFNTNLSKHKEILKEYMNNKENQLTDEQFKLFEDLELNAETFLVFDLLPLDDDKRDDFIVENALKYKILFEDPKTKKLIFNVIETPNEKSIERSIEEDEEPITKSSNEQSSLTSDLLQGESKKDIQDSRSKSEESNTPVNLDLVCENHLKSEESVNGEFISQVETLENPLIKSQENFIGKPKGVRRPRRPRRIRNNMTKTDSTSYNSILSTQSVPNKPKNINRSRASRNSNFPKTNSNLNEGRQQHERHSAVYENSPKTLREAQQNNNNKPKNINRSRARRNSNVSKTNTNLNEGRQHHKRHSAVYENSPKTLGKAQQNNNSKESLISSNKKQDSTSSTNSGTDTDEDSNEESSHEIEKSSLSIEAILILDLLNMSNSEREDLLIQKAVKYTILTEDPATKNLIFNTNLSKHKEILKEYMNNKENQLTDEQFKLFEDLELNAETFLVFDLLPLDDDKRDDFIVENALKYKILFEDPKTKKLIFNVIETPIEKSIEKSIEEDEEPITKSSNEQSSLTSDLLQGESKKDIQDSRSKSEESNTPVNLDLVCENHLKSEESVNGEFISQVETLENPLIKSQENFIGKPKGVRRPRRPRRIRNNMTRTDSTSYNSILSTQSVPNKPKNINRSHARRNSNVPKTNTNLNEERQHHESHSAFYENSPKTLGKAQQNNNSKESLISSNKKQHSKSFSQKRIFESKNKNNQNDMPINENIYKRENNKRTNQNSGIYSKNQSNNIIKPLRNDMQKSSTTFSEKKVNNENSKSEKSQKSCLNAEMILIMDLLDMPNDKRQKFLVEKALEYRILIEDSSDKSLFMNKDFLRERAIIKENEPKKEKSVPKTFEQQVNAIIGKGLNENEKQNFQFPEYKNKNSNYFIGRRFTELLENFSQKCASHNLGTIIEAELNVNSHNNEQGFIRYSPDAMIPTLLLRKCALHGDIVRCFIRKPSKALENEAGVITEYDETSLIEQNEELENPKSLLAFVIKIIKRANNKYCVGNFIANRKNRDYIMFLPRDKKLPLIRVPKRYWTEEFLDGTSKELENVIYKVERIDWNETTCVGKIKDKIGECDDIQAETNAILIQNNMLFEPYNQKINEMFEKPITITEVDLIRRRDMRPFCVFTIDPLSAQDLDDALSIVKYPNGNFEVGVHISDVSHFIKEFSELDNLIKERTTSTYLVNEVFHMLPETLCNKCSLLPGEDKMTFSVFWKMTPDAKILETNIQKTIVKSCTKFAYEHAQKIIDNPDQKLNKEDFPKIYNGYTIDNIAEKIKDLHNLATILRKERFKNGSLSLNRTKINFTLDSDTGEPIKFTKYVGNTANFLVEEFMLMANQSVASFIFKSFPSMSILRHHLPPKIQYLTKIEKLLLESYGIKIDISSSKALTASIKKTIETHYDPVSITEIIYHFISKPMQRALYICSDQLNFSDFYHYALAIPIYTHFTSPIRRYPDILVHRVLSAAIDHEEPPKRNVAELNDILNVCNTRKYDAKTAGDDSIDFFFIRYVKSMEYLNMRSVIIELEERYCSALTFDSGHLIRINYRNLKEEIQFLPKAKSKTIVAKFLKGPYENKSIELNLCGIVWLKVYVKGRDLAGTIIMAPLRKK